MLWLHAGLAASANVVGVSLGGILGHCMCTGGAVLGGRQMAAYVAERTLAVCLHSQESCFEYQYTQSMTYAIDLCLFGTLASYACHMQ